MNKAKQETTKMPIKSKNLNLTINKNRHILKHRHQKLLTDRHFHIKMIKMVAAYFS